MTRTIEELEEQLGMPLLPWQREAFTAWLTQPEPQRRLCLYHRTGAGKTLTSLGCMALAGVTEVLAIAPPTTHENWREQGARLGLNVTAVSHAKFRMSDFKLSRNTAIIADEFHMFGGHNKKGWAKLDRIARALKQPIVIASATPNYNDAERCYCIQHILDPQSVKGGFIEFLYQHCTTEQNPFGTVPIVTGFHQYKDAEAYLAALPKVVHLPDNVFVHIFDLPLTTTLPDEFRLYGVSRRKRRIMASMMEARHTRAVDLLVNSEDDAQPPRLHSHVLQELRDHIPQEPTLLFSNSATVARIATDTLQDAGYNATVLTGAESQRAKQHILDLFRARKIHVLVGTSTLATGTDGLDKVCDTLIIVQDTDDNALRRQLIGRILPRGTDVDASNKRVYRLLVSD